MVIRSQADFFYEIRRSYVEPQNQAQLLSIVEPRNNAEEYNGGVAPRMWRSVASGAEGCYNVVWGRVAAQGTLVRY